ncbi:MAG: phosphoribulokinase [Marmoricola sp.]
MTDKMLPTTRSESGETRLRPVMLAIAGDSAAGKTTLTKGLVEALGDRCTSICVDDYHRYDREERKTKSFTPLHPDCNYLDIMEQDLQRLAMGRPILKPVYEHVTGTFTRPAYVEPREFVIVEGLHPLSTELARSCFDVSVFLDPPEEIRRQWKIDRDCAKRGYDVEQVLADLAQREPESEAYIRPQRERADIVARFAPISTRDDPPGTPLSAELMLRPTIQHPSLSAVLTDDHRTALHLKMVRDTDGIPTDCLHVHGHASTEEARLLEKAIWTELAVEGGPPESLGQITADRRSEPLALTQLILLYHLLSAREGDRSHGGSDA